MDHRRGCCCECLDFVWQYTIRARECDEQEFGPDLVGVRNVENPIVGSTPQILLQRYERSGHDSFSPHDSYAISIGCVYGWIWAPPDADESDIVDWLDGVYPRGSIQEDSLGSGVDLDEIAVALTIDDGVDPIAVAWWFHRILDTSTTRPGEYGFDTGLVDGRLRELARATTPGSTVSVQSRGVDVRVNFNTGCQAYTPSGIFAPSDIESFSGGRLGWVVTGKTDSSDIPPVPLRFSESLSVVLMASSPVLLPGFDIDRDLLCDYTPETAPCQRFTACGGTDVVVVDRSLLPGSIDEPYDRTVVIDGVCSAPQSEVLDLVPEITDPNSIGDDYDDCDDCVDATSQPVILFNRCGGDATVTVLVSLGPEVGQVWKIRGLCYEAIDEIDGVPEITSPGDLEGPIADCESCTDTLWVRFSFCNLANKWVYVRQDAYEEALSDGDLDPVGVVIMGEFPSGARLCLNNRPSETDIEVLPPAQYIWFVSDSAAWLSALTQAEEFYRPRCSECVPFVDPGGPVEPPGSTAMAAPQSRRVRVVGDANAAAIAGFMSMNPVQKGGCCG